MESNIWHWKRFKPGDTLIFKGKKYVVTSQSEYVKNSFYFKNVRYTGIRLL